MLNILEGWVTKVGEVEIIFDFVKLGEMLLVPAKILEVY